MKEGRSIGDAMVEIFWDIIWLISGTIALSLFISWVTGK